MTSFWLLTEARSYWRRYKSGEGYMQEVTGGGLHVMVGGFIWDIFVVPAP